MWVPKLEALVAKSAVVVAGAATAAATAASADPVALRLLASPDRLERLQRLHGSLQDTRSALLPAVSAQVGAA